MSPQSRQLLQCFLAISITGFVPARTQSTVSVDQGRINKLIETAKQDGLSSITDNVVVSGDYGKVTSLEDALGLNVPIVVRIDKKVVTLSSSGDQIVSWYRANIIDNTSSQTLPNWNNIPELANAPPPALGPLSGDSVVVETRGGVFTKDGVTIYSSEMPLSFKVGETYLLFLNFEENRAGQMTRIGRLLLGDGGTFAANPASDRFTSVARHDNLAFSSRLINRCAGSLSMLKSDSAVVALRAPQ